MSCADTVWCNTDRKRQVSKKLVFFAFTLVYSKEAEAKNIWKNFRKIFVTLWQVLRHFSRTTTKDVITDIWARILLINCFHNIITKHFCIRFLYAETGQWQRILCPMLFLRHFVCLMIQSVSSSHGCWQSAETNLSVSAERAVASQGKIFRRISQMIGKR